MALLHDHLFALTLLLPVAHAQQPATEIAELTLEGRVVDLRGEGVRLARVAVVDPDDERVLARTVADGDGFFRVGRVLRTERRQIRATADGRCEGRTSASSNLDFPALVEVHDAATLRGILRNQDGAAAPGVAVRARPITGSLTSVQIDTSTDDTGTFVLRGVPLGPTGIVAWIEGEGMLSAQTCVDRDATIELVRVTGPHTDIDVQFEGLPKERAADVRVTVRRRPPLRLHSWGPTLEFDFLPSPCDELPLDAQLRARMSALPDHGYEIVPRAKGLAFAPPRQEVDARRGPHTVRFTCIDPAETPAGCRAIARDGEGKPVAGVTFVARSQDNHLRVQATSSVNGTVLFAGPMETGQNLWIEAIDDHWVVDPTSSAAEFLSFYRSKQVAPANDGTVVDLRLIPSCQVRGRLLLPDGSAAAFVRIDLQRSRANSTPEWSWLTHCITDRDGRFVVHGLRHIDDAVRAHVASGSGTWTSAQLALKAVGTRIDLGTAQLSPPAIVEGRVLDRDGQPVRGRRVWLHTLDGSANWIERVTDREGRYRFLGVPIGDVRLSVPPGLEDASAESKAMLEVAAGQTHVVDLTLPPR